MSYFIRQTNVRLINKNLISNESQSFLKLLQNGNPQRFTQIRWSSFKFQKKPKPERRKIGYTTREKNQTTMYYVMSLGVLTAGASYAAVPLYRMFCQVSGYGGSINVDFSENTQGEKVAGLEVNTNREIEIEFNADLAAQMRWNFKPQQSRIFVYPGETALAFYTARNPTAKPIDGISTYNVVPFEAGLYFNKIQCFCFEEQRLNPGEEVDMPVFFYIDPEFAEDPNLEKVNKITLSYTFFESRPGLQLPGDSSFGLLN